MTGAATRGDGGLLARLPAALRSRRDVLDGQEHWADATVLATCDLAAVLSRPGPAGTLVWAVGDVHQLEQVVPHALAACVAPLRWVTAPRAVRVAPDVLAAAGVVPCTRWDRFTADVAPAPQAGEDVVVPLDPAGDGTAIASCLDLANPTTHARPGAPDDAGWWGVRDHAGGLLGVLGVAARPGARVPSRHLHGLGVVPAARGRGLGAALTSRATRHALGAGAPWVSLGMYADNTPARRIYVSLGFRLDAENAGYGPPGATRP